MLRGFGFTLCNSGRSILIWFVAVFVMPGLVPGIHVLKYLGKQDVDGRVKPGHDGENLS